MDDEIEITADDVRPVPAQEPVPAANPVQGGTLRKPVKVAGDGDPAGSPLKTLPAGTNAANIPPSELAQLCQEHFD